MKRMTTPAFLRFLLAGLCLVAVTACDSLDDRLEETNTSPTAANDINPDFQFADVLLRMSGDRFETWRANLIYSSVAVQQNATLAGYWCGDKYFACESYTAAFWGRRYGDPVRNLTDLITSTAADPQQINRNLMARATRVLLFHRLTDLYGDVPYSEAGKGYTESILQPKYDAQEAIYEDMVDELKAVRRRSLLRRGRAAVAPVRQLPDAAHCPAPRQGRAQQGRAVGQQRHQQRRGPHAEQRRHRLHQPHRRPERHQR
jgi:hypothetical protein